MKPRLLLGLMLCTLFSMSAPAFAQPSTVQPVLNTAQAATDVTIPQGTTQVFDASKGEIKFDGVLTNKGTIIIRSSDPAQAEAILRAGKVINEGKIVSEVPTLTIRAESVTGKGEATATESIAIQNDKDLQIIGGKYRANFFRPSTDGKLNIQAQRIDAKVDLKAFEVSIGVNEGNLDIIGQKLDGDPIYYNRGGDITAVMPSNGEDIYVLAAGNVTLSNVDTSGGASGEVGRLVVSAGVHFAITVNDGNSQFPCGTFGASCPNVIEQNSGPGQIFEPAPGGPFPPSGTITLNGAKARVISLFARDIVVNGTLQAIDDPTTLAAPAILLTAANSITVNAQLKTDQSVIEPNYGIVALEAPTINVNGKITSDHVFIAAFENSVASTGSITTAAIEARTYIEINGGHIQFAESGGAFAGSAVLPLSQPHDSGEFTIKTGKLTAHRYVVLAATGNIDAGNIELLPNEANVPLGTHDVRIHANVGKEDAPPLKIGGGTNGAASITVRGTTDLGAGLTQKTGAIFLTNGPSGDIVLDGAKITVTNEHDGTPSLIAYAGTGQVTVKGSIVLDGTSSAPAGQILLVGDEIRSTGATLSAKDTLSAPADNPAKVVLVASKLTLAGDLTIEANSKAQTSVRVVPKGSVTLDPQDNFPGIYVNVDKFPVNVTEDEVLVGGSANLTIKAKSDEAKVEITAKPLKFNNGTSLIAATGTGSQITVDIPGSPLGVNSLIFNGDGVTFDASNPDGDAGTVNIIADKVRNTASANVSLKANGGGTNGSGGVVALTVDRGNLDLGSGIEAMSISATSKGGNKGSIIIDNSNNNGKVYLAEQALAPALDASALLVDGEGGDITITAGQFINNSTGEVAQILANGADTKSGGTISIQADIVNLFDTVVKADGGSSRGNGGNVNVVASNSMKIGLSVEKLGFISAKGFGDGRGGNVKLLNSEVDLTNARITANGGESGEGGTVEVTALPQTLRLVNQIIKVSPGENLADPNAFGGSISLNFVKCRQYLSGSSSWPYGYWNCVHPDSPVAGDELPLNMAQGLPASRKAELQIDKTQIYTQTDVDQFTQFFGGAVDPAAGYTFTEGVGESTNVASFQFSTLYVGGYQQLTSNAVKESSVHELGHGIDLARQVESAGAPFVNAVNADLNYLNFVNGNPRPPCSMDGSAPFDGLIDFRTGAQFCTYGVLNNPGGIYTDPNTGGLHNNGNIGFISDSTLGPPNPPVPSQGAEFYAQTFAYQAFAKMLAFPGGYFRTTADGLFNKGYFGCAQAQAAQLAGTSYTPGYTCP